MSSAILADGRPRRAPTPRRPSPIGARCVCQGPAGAPSPSRVGEALDDRVAVLAEGRPSPTGPPSRTGQLAVERVQAPPPPRRARPPTGVVDRRERRRHGVLAERAADHRRVAVLLREHARRRSASSPQLVGRDGAAQRRTTSIAAASTMSWLVAPRWHGPPAARRPTSARSRGSSGMTRLPPSAAPSTMASTSKRSTRQAVGDRRRGVLRDVARRRPGRRPARPRRRASPATQALRRTSAPATGAGSDEEPERSSSDGEEDGLIVTLQVDVEAVTVARRAVGDERACGGSARPTAQRGIGGVGVGLVAEVARA